MMRYKDAKVPKVIGWRLEPDIQALLMKWRKGKEEVPWSRLIRHAVLMHLRPIAGKRYSHLYKYYD